MRSWRFSWAAEGHPEWTTSPVPASVAATRTNLTRGSGCRVVFRIDFLPGLGAVAMARNSLLVDVRADARQQGITQLHVSGAQVFQQVLHARRTGDRQDVLALVQQPGQRQLRRRAAR